MSHIARGCNVSGNSLVVNSSISSSDLDGSIGLIAAGLHGSFDYTSMSVEDCTFTQNELVDENGTPRDDISVGFGSGIALSTVDGFVQDNSTIKNCTIIENSHTGITVGFPLLGGNTLNTTIVNNVINANRLVGIDVISAVKTLIAQNILSNNPTGIQNTGVGTVEVYNTIN